VGTVTRNCAGRAFFTSLLVLAACNSTSGSAPSTTHAKAAGISRPLSDHTTIPPDYFGGSQRFCARAPLSGTIAYVIRTDRRSGSSATLNVHVGGLPSNSQTTVNWANGTGRAYVVASVDTDGNGSSVQASVRLYRPGEVRGARIILALTDPQATVVGTLTDCS